jgi:hypothetical protein
MTTAHSHLPKDGHRQFGELPTKGELVETVQRESRKVGNGEAGDGPTEPPEELCLGEDENLGEDDNENRESAGEDRPEWSDAGEDESLL